MSDNDRSHTVRRIPEGDATCPYGKPDHPDLASQSTWGCARGEIDMDLSPTLTAHNSRGANFVAPATLRVRCGKAGGTPTRYAATSRPKLTPCAISSPACSATGARPPVP